MASITMVDACCLCGSDVSAGTLKVKKRKMNGKASKQALDVIDQLAHCSYSKKFSMTVSPDAYICHKCENKAEVVAALQRKLLSAENYIITVIHWWCFGSFSTS